MEFCNMRFETSAEEIMKAGAAAIMEMMSDKPALVLIHDDLTSAIALTAAKWQANKMKEE